MYVKLFEIGIYSHIFPRFKIDQNWYLNIAFSYIIAYIKIKQEYDFYVGFYSCTKPNGA